MTYFAACFLLVFGELAFGGLFALAVPPFFKVERGFYKSSAAVYLASGLLTAIGAAMLASRGVNAGGLSVLRLWMVCAACTAFALVLGLYLFTLYTDLAALRSRAFTGALALGLFAVTMNALWVEPAGLG